MSHHGYRPRPVDMSNLTLSREMQVYIYYVAAVDFGGLQTLCHTARHGRYSRPWFDSRFMGTAVHRPVLLSLGVLSLNY